MASDSSGPQEEFGFAQDKQARRGGPALALRRLQSGLRAQIARELPWRMISAQSVPAERLTLAAIDDNLSRLYRRRS
jgi:hypothetical protein